MLTAIILLGAVVCAVGAIRANRLLVSALWLAGTSALVSIVIYILGAPEVAVIELSVGAGLVTVLFVFAINIAGEEAIQARSLIPKPLAWVLIALSMALLGWMSIPGLASTFQVTLPIPAVSDFARTFWEIRGLDILGQIVMIFSGVLGVLGLLAEAKGSSYKEAH